MKKTNIIIIFENIILGIIKLFFIGTFTLAANLNDNVITITELQKTNTLITGILLALSFDILFTFLFYYILHKKIKFKKLIAYSLFITLLEIIIVM